MPSLNHVHKYKRLYIDKAKKTPIFRCMLPDCSHFLDRKLAIGRKNICWKCGEGHILGMFEVSMVHPNCGCERKSKRVADKIEEGSSFTIEDLLKRI